MRTKVREMFDKIDEFIVNSDPKDVKNFWDLMVALRGPDIYGDNAQSVKDHTTIQFRRAAFPKVAKIADSYMKYNGGGLTPQQIEIMYGINSFTTYPFDMIKAMDLSLISTKHEWNHFKEHAKLAQEAIQAIEAKD